MREKYTVLIPSMLDFHMQLFKGIFTQVGFKAEIMTNEGEGVVNEGLKYVHNDICYPALLVIGQCIDNLKNRENTDNIAVLISQTGGGCRASNYKFLLKKALNAAGFSHVPILTFNFSELHKVTEIGIQYTDLLKVLQAVFYGDMLMYLNNKTRSYETVKGSSKQLTLKWIDILMEQFS